MNHFNIETVILLIGYNRPDFVRNRLQELKNEARLNIFISIDFCNKEMSLEMEKIIHDFLSDEKLKSRVKFRIHESNQGLALHITQAISDLMSEYDSVIVIEDDVSINENTIDTFLTGLNLMKSHHEIASVGGYSPIGLPRMLERVNFLRVTRYFSCWGWATNRRVWEMYQFEIGQQDIARSLQGSSTWNALTEHQKQTWTGRFRKVSFGPPYTWDFQFQYMCFKYSMKNILPFGRILENVGFMDQRSSHTKSIRPWWMGHSVPPKSTVKRFYLNKKICSTLEWVESYTIIGDRKRKNLTNKR